MGISIATLQAVSGAWNVSQNGAVGNGTADDTAAIQATIAAAGAGGVVFFEPKTYLIDTLTIPASGMTFVGCGRGLTTLLKKTTGSTQAPMLYGSSVSNITIKDMTFNGQNTSQSYWQPNPYDSQPDVDSIQFTLGSKITIVDVELLNSVRAGIQLYGTQKATIRCVRGVGNGFGTISLYNSGSTGCDWSEIIGGIGDSDYCDACRVVQTNNVTISGWKGINAGINGSFGAPQGYAGIYLNSCTNSAITGCAAYGNSQRGIDCDATNTGGSTGTYDITITGCVVHSHTNGGILAGTAGHTITGNSVKDCGYTAGGIQLQGTGHCVTGNSSGTRSSTQAYGVVRFAATVNCMVVGNSFLGNTTAIDSNLSSDSGFVSASNVT